MQKLDSRGRLWVQELELPILPWGAEEDWMGPAPSNSAICRDLGAVFSFLEIHCSEIYVCSAYTGDFENRDPCTMGTWANSFGEMNPELII